MQLRTKSIASAALMCMPSPRFPGALRLDLYRPLAPVPLEYKWSFQRLEFLQHQLLHLRSQWCPNPTPGWTSANGCNKLATPSPPPRTFRIRNPLPLPHPLKLKLPPKHEPLGDADADSVPVQVDLT
ncbi:hypothetical protein M758_11G028100 [Ceratodon purpureus]|nr:hypothetical protein M758_11G028100 [Ceratodon purpureus]